jgi:tubulin polyglutamylase TTLL5
LEERDSTTADWVYTYAKKRLPPTAAKKGPSAIGKRKYLIFRPYVDPMTTPPTTPPNRGYYYVMYNSEVKLIQYILEDNGFCRLPPKQADWSIMWHGGPPKPQVFYSMTKYQKINHMPRTFEITRKDQMFKNISRMASMYGKNNFDFVP